MCDVLCVLSVCHLPVGPQHPRPCAPAQFYMRTLLSGLLADVSPGTGGVSPLAWEEFSVWEGDGCESGVL